MKKWLTRNEELAILCTGLVAGLFFMVLVMASGGGG